MTYYTLFDAGNMRLGFACQDDGTCKGGRGDVSGNVVADVTRTWVNAAFVGGGVAVVGLGAYTLYAMNMAEQVGACPPARSYYCCCCCDCILA
jgi:hypothetical protein